MHLTNLEIERSRTQAMSESLQFTEMELHGDKRNNHVYTHGKISVAVLIPLVSAVSV